MKIVKVTVAAFIGLFMLFAVTSQIAKAQSTAAPMSPGPSIPQSSPLTYAWVITANVDVYANPGDAAPARNLGKGFLYVSLASTRPVVVGDQKWYQLRSGGYINANNLIVVRPSAFHGITLTVTPDKPFGWIVVPARPSISAGEIPTKSVTIIYRYTPITVYDQTKIDDVTWYRIGDNQWVDQKKVDLVFPTTRPSGVGPTDQWIDVNRFEQTLAAYEGDRMVYATLVSSGLPQWDTDLGLFRIYMKVRQAKMSGRDGLPDYYWLDDVPWAMYFNSDMALHGAYWHDKFGYKHSHGCVNLPPADALWLWNWTTPDATGKSFVMVPDVKNNTEGTWVWVHD